jgi:hypothetical protein
VGSTDLEKDKLMDYVDTTDATIDITKTVSFLTIRAAKTTFHGRSDTVSAKRGSRKDVK